MDASSWLIIFLTLVGAALGCWLWSRRGATRQRELARRLADRSRELAALNKVATVVGRSLELDEVLAGALEATLEVMAVEAGGVYLLDEREEVLRLAAQRGLSAEFVSGADRLQPGEGFSGQVVRTGEPLVVNDLSRDQRLARDVMRREGLRSLIVVPLRSKAEVLGTLFVVTREECAFIDRDTRLLESIGQQVGLAVDNARLFDTVQRRAEQFRVIAEVGRQITSTLDTEAALVRLVQLIREAFRYYHVAIGLIEGDEVVYRFGAGELWDDPGFGFQPSRLKVGREGLSGWVAGSGDPLIVADVSREPRYVWMDGSLTRSELIVPIRAKDEILGVLDVQSDRLNDFDEIDLVTMQSLADQAAVAIQNARLYEQAQRVAVLEERQRLARELHDAVTQTLFSASLIAEALPTLWNRDAQEGLELLEELRRLSRGALAEMRTLLLELRPAALVEARLADLLRQLADAITGRERLPVTLAVEEIGPLPPDVHVAFYRTAQEALNNVVKHSRANRVEIGLRHVPETGVELVVRDDGRGFDPGEVLSDGLGLGIMRERAQAIGALLVVESELGCGTRVRLMWAEGKGG